MTGPKNQEDLHEGPEKHKKVTKWIEYDAAPRLLDIAKSRGLNVYSPPLRVQVTSTEGPLAEGAIEKVKDYAKEFLSKLKD